MNLDLSESELAFQAEAREWLAANVPGEPLPSMDTPEGFVAHQEWEAKLAEARWAVVSWPEEYHGRGASLVEWVIFEEEYYRAGAPGRVSQNGIFLLSPTIFENGTREQQDRWLPTMATGETIWAQAWSEPEAGSDLASLRSRAERDETRGGWVLNGQKTWSSRAAYAHWGFGLFRSDPESQRHHGLTYFCFPLDAEGVTVRPIAQLDGEPGFAELFFDDVFVPDADVLGEPGQGWSVAMSTAGNERGLSLRSPGRFCATAERLVDLWRSAGLAGGIPGPRGRRVAGGRGLPPVHVGHRLPARRRRFDRVRRLGQQGVLVRPRRGHARDRPRPARPVIRAARTVDGRLRVLAVRPDLRRHQRGAAQRDRRTHPRPARESEGRLMDFRLTPEQTGFAQSLTELMTKADSVAAARAWAAGDHAPGQALWKRVADQGVTALVLSEDEGGLGGTPVDLVVAFEVLGHQLAVGPWIESAALAPQAEGEMVTAGVSPVNPYAVDADVATLLHGSVSDSLLSVDTTRRLFEVHDAQPFDEGAIDLAVLACSAELLGCGERLLADSVEYVQQRKQYGRAIGSYQAIKHQLADVRIALDFARPLVHGAALCRC